MLQQQISSNVSNSPIKVASLQKIMQYENPDLIIKFCKEWSVSQDEAKDIFEETKKFIFLAAQCQTECFDISVYQQMQVIDEMWHTFLLFTDQYYHFCEEYLGGFLHHFPFTRKMLQQEIKHVSRSNISFEAYKQNSFRAQVLKTKEILGEDTVIKWFGQYAHKYSIENLNALRKPLVSSEASGKGTSQITSEILAMPKDHILKFIMDSRTILNVTCGCSGSGCGAGCACNSSPHHA
ncbi:hypothetical protein IFT96_18630 [Pseudomonas fluorescens]|uniref:glycine-rich domain-containing protein n=1 Tax=Pseudomonas TaxID=286 RepID=UPI000CF32CA5|nr:MULTISPECIES: hypothetical protein [Pseudomonas]MBD8238356.1 hypothetical protein [Pseudomonas fluorescens]MBD8257395.1 hypothetical protein [Pseudomonas fluorescens]MDY0895880.1 hypothetical protein [Pseudomonas fluorescens]NJJ55135.1 hypothetical protein [Pseudomonas sp. B14(2022)]